MTWRNEAEIRYRLLRKQAYLLAEQSLKTLDQGIRLSEITGPAIQAAKQWKREESDQSSKRRLAYWDWQDSLARFRRRPRRVELAIWHGQTMLCGLALGRTSNRRVVATIHLLERDPSPTNPLIGLVAPIALRFLDTYARLLGCSEIAINDPFPEVVDYYKSLGLDRVVTKGKKVISMHQKLTSIQI